MEESLQHEANKQRRKDSEKTGTMLKAERFKEASMSSEIKEKCSRKNRMLLKKDEQTIRKHFWALKM